MDYQLPSRSPVIVVICTLNLRVVALRLIHSSRLGEFWVLVSGFWVFAVFGAQLRNCVIQSTDAHALLRAEDGIGEFDWFDSRRIS
jgi:hypothetical protein